MSKTLENTTISEYETLIFSEKKTAEQVEVLQRLSEEMQEILSNNDFLSEIRLFVKYIRSLIKEILASLGKGKFGTREKILREQILSEMNEPKKNDSKMTPQSFSEWVLGVGKFMGYHIKRNEMHMLEFCTATALMHKELKHQMNALIAQKNKL